MSQNALAIAGVLTEMGFEMVRDSTIIQKLNRIQPNGETALHDSIATGISLILRLNSFLEKMDHSGLWNFVHIVITDGVDTVSSTSTIQLSQLFDDIGKNIQRKSCLTVLIGIQLTQPALTKLVDLKTIGGENCMIFNAVNVNLAEIFNDISLNIGIGRQVMIDMNSGGGIAGMQSRYVPVLQVVRKRYAVLLNLDLSTSMNGVKYTELKNSTGRFLANLDGGDLASCLVFNSRVQLLNSIPMNIPGSYNNNDSDSDDDDNIQIRCNTQ